MRSPSRLLLALLVVVVMATAGTAWWWTHRVQHADPDDHAASGTRAITYQDLRVVIPASWERRELDGCEFRFEHWSRHSVPHCDTESGVSFYASATFDPATGPGVRRSRTGAATAWSGYVVLGSVQPRQ